MQTSKRRYTQDNIPDETEFTYKNDSIQEMSDMSDEEETIDQVDPNAFTKDKARVIVEIKTFMLIYQQTLVEFFEIKESVSGKQNRVNREMLENFITSLVLSGPIYIFMYCLLGIGNYEQIQKLQIIVQGANVSL